MNPLPSPESTALSNRLSDLAAVIEDLDDVAYLSKRTDGVSGSIGAHVRHTIDHVVALVEPASTHVIDYDTRRRGTEVERSRRAGARELRRLSALITRMRTGSAAPLKVNAVVDPAGLRVTSDSTLGRELVFVLSHTVHHQAIIALLLAERGRSTPDRFALAPSTPSPVTCARSA